MKKALNGNMFRAKLVLWFALAFVMVCGFTTHDVSAQSDWRLVPLDLQVVGGANGTVMVKSASAILAATDMSPAANNVATQKWDGALVADATAGNFITRSRSQNGLNISSKSIIANIQTNDPLHMVAVIENVDPNLVTSIRNGGSADSVISNITAAFPSELFGRTRRTQVTALNPVGATGINPNAKFGANVASASSLVVWWEGISSLVVNASTDNSVFHSTGVQATVQINGGVNGKSNPVGAEIGSDKVIGPMVVDAVAGMLHGATITSAFDADDNSTLTLFPGFQFRAGDQVEVKFAVQSNAANDGEPDSIFGTASDGLDNLTGTNTRNIVGTSGTNRGSRINISSDLFTLGGISLGTDVIEDTGLSVIPEGGGIFKVTATLKDITTFGPHQPFTIKFTIADDVGNATNTDTPRIDQPGLVTGKFDTLPPSVTDVTITSGSKSGDRYQVSNNAPTNLADLTVDIAPANEDLINPQNWINFVNLQALADGNGVYDNWATIPPNPNVTYTNTNVAAPGGGSVSGIRATFEDIMVNTNSTYPNAFIAFQITDDARNKALVTYNTTANWTQFGQVPLASRSANIYSVSPFRAIHPNGISGVVAPATVEVDNNPPITQRAKLDVVAFPNGFMDGTGQNSADRFNQLRSTFESLDSDLTQEAINRLINENNNVTNVDQAIAVILANPAKYSSVIRGTVGSQLRVMVEFDPDGLLTEDTDDVVPNNISLNDYIKNAFGYRFTSGDMGFTATDLGGLINDQEWNFVNGAASGGIFSATFVTKNGIPGPVANSLQNASINATVFDQVLNAGASIASTTIKVDIDAPSINNASADVVISNNQIPVTNPNTHILEPGDSIVLSAEFNENSGVNSSDPFSEIGGLSGYPFVYELNGDSADVVINSASTLFAIDLHTIRADFSAWDTSDSSVLPTYIENRAPGRDMASLISGDTVYAEWNYMIDPNSANLVDTDDIRNATIVARDLSGNVNREGFEIGKADFDSADGEIVYYEINTPNKVQNAILQNAGGYDPFPGGATNAFQISAATAAAGVNASTFTLVVRGEDGPFNPTDPVQIDLSDFGTPGLHDPSAITFGANTFHATFANPFGSSIGLSQTPDASVDVLIRSVTGAVKVLSTVPIQRDGSAPVVSVTPTVRQLPTFGPSDDINDSIVRPGQVVEVRAKVTVDNYENNTNVMNNFIVTLSGPVARDGNGNNITAVFNPTSFTKKDGNEWEFFWQITLPTSGFDGAQRLFVQAIDHAKNVSNTGQTDQIISDDTAPFVFDNVFDSTSTINLANGTFKFDNRVNTQPFIISGALTDVVGGEGNVLSVSATIDPRDLSFQDPTQYTFTADFSQYSGNANVQPATFFRDGPNFVVIFRDSATTGGANITNASVRLDLVDPSGIAAEGSIYTATASADRSRPVVSLSSGYFINGNQINNNQITTTSATASVIAYATFEDVRSFPNILNGPGQVAAAGSVKSSTRLIWLDMSRISNAAGASKIAPSKLTLGSSTNNDDQVLTIIGDNAASTAQILASTLGVLRAEFPTNVINKTNANGFAVVNVQDTVGWVGKANTPSVYVDVTPPTVKDQKLALAVDAATTTFLPAIYAGDRIVRPTRVSNGTPMVYSFNVEDVPSREADGYGRVKFGNFGAANQSYIFSGTQVTHVARSFVVNSNGGAKTTFPINTANPLEVPAYPLTTNASYATIINEATDSLNNFASYNFNSHRFEIDMQGPQVAQWGIGIYGSHSEVANVTNGVIPTTPTVANLTPGQWLLWAARIVIDGDQEIDGDNIHFNNFMANFEDVFNSQFITRVAQTQSGYTTLTKSATRTVIFATQAMEVRTDAIASEAFPIEVTFEDYFGNRGGGTYGFVAINAQGPRATEIVLSVDGRSRNLSGVTINDLGLGNLGPDSNEASFEMAPGMALVVDATITPQEVGQQLLIPSRITADFSALYPPHLKNSVDAIVPTHLVLTDQGTVYARWERIITYEGDLIGSNDPESSLYTLASFADIQLLDNTENGLDGNDNPKVFLSTRGIQLNNTSVAPGDNVTQAQLNSLIGLPNIAAQPSANPAKQIRIPITVDDSQSPFMAGVTNSNRFALDSKEPTAAYDIVVLERDLEPTVRDANGFPLAPNKRPEVPARVRGGDLIEVIVNLENADIDGDQDDLFRTLPGYLNDPESIFALAASPDLLDVSADLSEFTVGVNNALATQDGTIYSVSYEMIDGQPSNITATFQTVVSSSIGTSSTESRRIRSILPTIVDDAGLAPRNNPFEDANLTRDVTLAVDNRAPAISGSLEVVDSNTGESYENNDVIVAGQALDVSVTVTDLADNPLDVVQNPNFGDLLLQVGGFDQAVSVPVFGESKFTALDSIQVPFEVQMPPAETGVSTPAFHFIITATDTIGNSNTIESFDSYQFDGLPAITFAGVDSGVLNVGHMTTVTANAYDTGGVDFLSMQVPTIAGISFVPAPGTPDNYSINANGEKNASVGVVITPSLNTVDTSLQLSAFAEDIDGATNTSAITLAINHPALFAEIFGATVTSSAGNVSNSEIASTTGGYNISADEDIRDITVEEGDTLEIAIEATDIFGDAVVVNATGAAMQFGELTNEAPGLFNFTFVPGYTASATETEIYSLVLEASDLSDIAPDIATVDIAVIPVSATPEIQLATVTIDGQVVSANLGDTVVVNEGQTLVANVVGTDAGGESLTFDAASIPEGVELLVSSESEVDGTIYGTVEFTPDFNFADLSKINFNNPLDPFSLAFSVSNGAVTSTESIVVDVENTSQPPILSATAVVNGNEPVTLEDGDSFVATPGDTVVMLFNAFDPDGDDLFLPNISVVSTDPRIDITGSITGEGNEFDGVFTVDIPSNICGQDATVAIIFNASDESFTQATESYTINVEVPSNTGGYDEVIVSQGYGDKMQVNVRNFDPNTTATNPNTGEVLQITSILRAYNGAAGSFLDGQSNSIGGGLGRSAYTSTGDVDGDGDMDIVTTMGVIVADATFPSIVVVRDAKTRIVVGHSFQAFFAAEEGEEPVDINYDGGEVRTAVGNFLGNGMNQIAVAQGFGGNNQIRLYQYTDNPAPNTYQVVGQFSGLAGGALTANANGGLSLAAGDLDGDGKDELVVSQTHSSTSLTQFTVLDISDNGTIERRSPFAGFQANFRNDQGSGVEIVVADLEGDGVNEIIASSQGLGVAAGPQINILSVIKPVVTDGVITGFSRPNGSIRGNIFTTDNNPSGAMSIAAGELDNCAGNGTELIIGTGSLYDIEQVDGETHYTVNPVLPAPQSRYRIVKLESDGSTVSGPFTIVGPTGGFPAFVGDFVVPSGAVWLSAANTDE